eukprot:10763402-Prorocentrum_lima.AAC.1
MAGQTHNRCDSGWIRPLSRIVNELAMELVCRSDQIISGDASGKDILLKKHYVIPYMEWDDVVG